MNRGVYGLWTAIIVGLAMVGTAAGLGATELVVDGGVTAGVGDGEDHNYHCFQSVSSTDPASGAIANLGDVLIRWDLEVGARVNFSSRPEHIGWIEGVSSTPDRLEIETPSRADPATDPEVRITSSSAVRLVADQDGDTNIVPFWWYNNGQTSSDQLADLDGAGHLRIGGSLTENQAFDVAEAFFREERVAPGELVRISPRSPRRILRSRGEGDGTMIGVVSAHPGVRLGGAPFAHEDLRPVWGDEIADLFLTERLEMEALALERPNGLRERAEGLRTFDLQAAIESEAENGGDPSARWEEDRLELQGMLETEALRVFFERHFAYVALAGRVPVRVDASFGAIEIGDPLTSSPIAGVAMKATAPGPVIGVALERWAAGTGTVTAFVDRGWYGGDAALEAKSRELAALRRGTERQKDRQIAELESRLAVLEGMVNRLAADRSRPAPDSGLRLTRAARGASPAAETAVLKEVR